MNADRIQTFQFRLCEAMRVREVNAAELAKKTGYNKANISQWVNGVYEAKQEGIYKLATALSVNEAWLMGYDVPMERTLHETLDDQCNASGNLANEVNLIEQIQNQFGKDAVQLLHIFMELNDLGKEKALENLLDLAELPKYTDEGVMFRAARSKEHTAPQVVKKSKDRISRLEKAPKVIKSDDL